MAENILAGVISGVISGVILIFFEQLLMPKFATIEKQNKELRVIEERKIIVKEKVVYKEQRSASEDDSTLFVLGIFVLMMVAVVNYIKYVDIIHFVITVISLAVGVMAVGMGIFCIRKGLRFRNDLNLILIFNTLALAIVPALLWQTTWASKKRGIDIELLRKQVIETGGITGLSDFSIALFFAYQIAGLIFVIIYMVVVLISNMYLISLINLNLNSRMKNMWLFINRKTYGLGSNVKKVILGESVFLLISYLMVSGIVLDLLSKQGI